MKKQHANPPEARTIALNVLTKVWRDEAYANLALNAELNKYVLVDMERRFVTELVYGAVKAGETLDLLLQEFVSRSLKKIAPRILDILRLGIYQIFFLERIPDSAACNEAVKQARKFGHEGTVKFVNAVLRNAIRFKENPGLASAPGLCQAVRLQHPAWLVERWEKQLGMTAAKLLCEINNQPAPMCLRANTLKITSGQLEEVLQREGVLAARSSLVEEGFVCLDNPSLLKLPSFRNGLYQVQDESSMLVAHYLDVQKGQFVLDLCAAPGGKATHIAALMGNKGTVLAADLHRHKLELIKENSARLGIDIVQPLFNDATVLRDEWIGKADRVLVDAPCSGLGVLRRRPDLRWRKRPSELDFFPELQVKILQNAARYLKSGGKMVYSTCTTEEAENMGTVESFLANGKEFKLEAIKHPGSGKVIECLQLWPHLDGTDGFFICVLNKM